MITKETARDIYNIFAQIETTEKMISELEQAVEQEDKKVPDIIRDREYHSHGSIVIEIPYFEAGQFVKERGSRVYNISYRSALRILKNHKKQLKKELKEINS